MAVGVPHLAVQERPEVIIGLGLETAKFGTSESTPADLAMTPEFAAILLRLLQGLQERGMLPDAPGSVSQHRRAINAEPRGFGGEQSSTKCCCRAAVRERPGE